MLVGRPVARTVEDLHRANLEGGERHVRTRRFPRLLHKTRPILRRFDGENRTLAAELQQSYKH